MAEKGPRVKSIANPERGRLQDDRPEEAGTGSVFEDRPEHNIGVEAAHKPLVSTAMGPKAKSAKVPSSTFM